MRGKTALYQKGTEHSAKNFRDNLGQSIDPTLIERVGQKLRATFDVWFGPLEPMPPVGPEDLAPRRFDYPSGVNLMGSPRSHEPVSFRQMRELADSLDLVRIAIETRKDQVGKMPWGFREKTRHSALGARHSVGKLGGSPRDVGIERLVREEQTVGTYE